MKLSIDSFPLHDVMRTDLVLGLLACLALAAPSTAQSFCEPGSAIICPCGNMPSGPPRGCNNSLGTGGSALNASGSPTIGMDTLVMTAGGIGSSGPFCTGSSFTQTSILIQGSAPIMPVAFFDGVRCVGGVLKRIQTALSQNGTYTSTVMISTTSAALGDPLMPGSIRYYFVYYRDPCPSFACLGPSDLVNASNAWKIMWM